MFSKVSEEPTASIFSVTIWIVRGLRWLENRSGSVEVYGAHLPTVGPKKGRLTSFPPTPVHLHSPHCWSFAGPSSRSPPTCPPQVQRTLSQWFVTSHVLSRTALFGQISSNFTRNPSIPRDAYTVFTPSLYRVDSVTCALIVGWRKISISSFRKQNRCWQCALPSTVVHAFCWLYNSGQKPSIYDGNVKSSTLFASHVTMYQQAYKLITMSRRVQLEKRIFPSKSRNSPYFMEPYGSLPCSQEPDASSYT